MARNKLPTENEIALAINRLESGDTYSSVDEIKKIALGLLQMLKGQKHDIQGLLQEVAELKNRPK